MILDRRLQGAVALICFVGCGSPRPTPTTKPEVETAVPDITYPDTAKYFIPSTSLAGTDLPMHAEFRIDGDTEPVILSQVDDVELDDQGRLYILDVVTQSVHIIDRSGHLVRTFGGEGRGPGELLNARGLAIVGDTVFVHDNALQIFSTDGEYLGGRNIGNPVPAVLDALHWTDEGFIAERKIGGSVSAGSEGSIVTVLYRMVEHQDAKIIPVRAINRVRPYVLGFVAPAPLDRPELLAFSRNHLFKIPSDSFRIDVYTVGGTPTAQIVSDVGRKKTRPSDVDDDWNGWEQRIGRNATVKSMVNLEEFRRAFHAAEPAEYRQTIGAVIADPDGSLLIQRNDLAERPYLVSGNAGGSRPWLLLGTDFKPRGQVVLPNGFKPLAFRACRVAGTIYSPDGVPSVEVFRIGEPSIACG